MSSRKFKQPSPNLYLDFDALDMVAPELPNELPPPDKSEYEGKLKKIEYEERLGKIINKEQSEHAAFDLGRLLRDTLAGMPARLAAKVSAEDNEKAVKRLIRNECDKCFRTILGRMVSLRRR